jgi:hydrogenase nickel incorporation protein HypA/HybF
MHELGIAEGILGVVLDKSDGERVRRVRVRVGRAKAVAPESLRFHFELAARDTRAAEAVLEISVVPGDLLTVDGVQLDSGWRLRPGA